MFDARRSVASIVRCGPIARRNLSRDGEACVVATMARGVYVALHDEDLIFIGSGPLCDGPINVEVAYGTGGFSELEAGSCGRLTSGTLRLGAHFALAANSGSTWTPPRLPQFSPHTTARGLVNLRTRLAQRLPADGVARIVLGARPGVPSDLLWRSAAVSIDLLEAGLALALSDGAWPSSALAAARDLVGLGPGLTPSGDDFLCGFLLALSAAKRTDLHQSLWASMEPHLSELTSLISRAFLRAAADGIAAAPLHAMLAALLRADFDRLEASVDAVLTIGHTSGWDGLCGLVLCLEGLIRHELEFQAGTHGTCLG